MVAMGGGAELPSRDGSREKELVLCTLPWPEEKAQKGIEALKKAFPDVRVKYYFTKFEDGKAAPVDVSEGKLNDV